MRKFELDFNNDIQKFNAKIAAILKDETKNSDYYKTHFNEVLETDLNSTFLTYKAGLKRFLSEKYKKFTLEPLDKKDFLQSLELVKALNGSIDLANLTKVINMYKSYDLSNVRAFVSDDMQEAFNNYDLQFIGEEKLKEYEKTLNALSITDVCDVNDYECSYRVNPYDLYTELECNAGESNE